jgi:hypothetical protein
MFDSQVEQCHMRCKIGVLAGASLSASVELDEMVHDFEKINITE